MTDKSMADYPYSIVPLLYPKNQNPPVNTPYIGLYYAGTAGGGFSIEQGAHYIELIEINRYFEQYDMTNAIQIAFDVRILNEKLGLIKSDDTTIISTTFENGQFPNNTIFINVTEILSQININSVISFEPWKYIMDRFTDYIANYFNGIFVVNHEPPLTKETFVQLFKSMKYTMQGEITVQNVTSMLRGFNNYDPFDNRADNNVEQGFITGDLLYIKNGLSITLSMDILKKSITINDLVINSTTNCFCDCKPPIQLNVKNKASYKMPSTLHYTITTPLLLKLVYPYI